ncbi:unnamed protein product [Paramecium octaurelia]|nr:unnamed protein product [Paramecium octaurelia]
MPAQKIIIRSSSSNKNSNSSKGFNYTQSKVFEKLVNHQKNRYSQEDDKYQQYFDHLGGQCLCTLCNCGKHHCNGKNCLNKPNLHLNKSIYQQEFVQKNPGQCSHYNQNLYLNPKQEGEIKRVTTYKHDYPGYLSSVQLQKGPKSNNTNYGSFSGMSTYNNMFKNWGVGDTPQLMPQNNPTIIQNLPFSGRSNYRDQFQEFNVEPAKSTKGLYQQKSPLSPPDIKFTATSIAKSSYIPIETERAQQQQAKKLQLQPLNPSYRGQYNTMYCKEFDSKFPRPCPAKEVLDEVEKQI